MSEKFDLKKMLEEIKQDQVQETQLKSLLSQEDIKELRKKRQKNKKGK